MRSRAGRWLGTLCLVPLACTLAGCKKGDGASKAWLEVCSGFASPTGGMLVGRIHAGEPYTAPTPGQGQLQRIEQSWESVDAKPLRDVALSITVGEREFKGIRSSDRGYIDLERLPGFTPPTVRIHLQLEDSRYQAAAIDAELPVYDDQPGLGIISDIDDTLLNSQVVDKAKMVKNAVTRSTWELETFPGAVSVVSGLAKERPIFYISGSPWGFRQRISDYFTRTGFPKGPLLLKRFSSDPLVDQQAYKWQHITRVVDSLPHKRWLLLGDSGEKDPEIYQRLSSERPGRVEAIYIHLVTSEDPAAPRFAGMKVFREWTELTAPGPT